MYEYARGQIVVWIPKNPPLDVTRGLQILLDPTIRKIAVANPEHAPYGGAAIAAMQHAGIYDKVRSKLIYGENIAQTAQFVQSGNADAGILALSLAKAPTLNGQGRYSIIPLSTYPPLEQAGVILKSSRKKVTARAFFDFLRKPGTVEIMARYGFMSPGKSAVNAASDTGSGR
jgi:molybdate transport system substrate-binding protein